MSRIGCAFEATFPSTPSSGSPHQSRHPVARSSRYTLGEPYRPLLSSCTVLMCARSCASSSTRFCGHLGQNSADDHACPLARHESYPLSVTPTVRQRAGVLMGVRSVQEQHPKGELRPLGMDERIAHFASLANQRASPIRVLFCPRRSRLILVFPSPGVALRVRSNL
jgi:hypothetical protein